MSKINKTISIDKKNLPTWDGLTNRSSMVNLLLEVASELDHPDDIAAKLRTIKNDAIQAKKEGEN